MNIIRFSFTFQSKYILSKILVALHLMRSCRQSVSHLFSPKVCFCHLHDIEKGLLQSSIQIPCEHIDALTCQFFSKSLLHYKDFIYNLIQVYFCFLLDFYRSNVNKVLGKLTNLEKLLQATLCSCLFIQHFIHLRRREETSTDGCVRS